MLPDLHTDFSRGRSGGLVFPSLKEFSTVYCDPHSQRLLLSNKNERPINLYNVAESQNIMLSEEARLKISYCLITPTWNKSRKTETKISGFSVEEGIA